MIQSPMKVPRLQGLDDGEDPQKLLQILYLLGLVIKYLLDAQFLCDLVLRDLLNLFAGIRTNKRIQIEL